MRNTTRIYARKKLGPVYCFELDFTVGIRARLAARSMYIIAPFEFKLFGRTIEILTEISTNVVVAAFERP